MIKRKIRGDRLVYTSLRYVQTYPGVGNVWWETSARRLTIELKSFITQINTKRSFALLTLKKLVNVNMVTSVHSLILRQRFQWSSSTSMSKTSTSTCFTSRQYGVHTMKRITKEMCACTPTIGKTSEENLICTTTARSSALTGEADHSLTHTKTGVRTNTDAQAATDGRSRNITLKTTN